MSVHLETERLVLRRFTRADVAAVVELDSDPEVMRYLTGGIATPEAEVRDVILPFWLAYYEQDQGYGFWVAEERASGRFLGWFHYRPHPTDPSSPDGSSETGADPLGTGSVGVELGYRLRRPAWGHGYATEGARALIRKGFTDLGEDRVYAQTMAVNTGSRRVLEKAGLRHVRTFFPPWPDPIPGDEHGEVEYALTRAEWESS